MPSQKDVAAESGAPMIPEQRRELILRQLRKQHVLSVHQLMEMFDCSHMTVRRDIALLEQEGLAYSVTGGVRMPASFTVSPATRSRPWLSCRRSKRWPNSRPVSCWRT